MLTKRGVIRVVSDKLRESLETGSVLCLRPCRACVRDVPVSVMYWCSCFADVRVVLVSVSCLCQCCAGVRVVLVYLTCLCPCRACVSVVITSVSCLCPFPRRPPVRYRVRFPVHVMFQFTTVPVSVEDIPHR